jgi:glyoxylase-like metal-dependent hydrolase (beta-lactamase superfamily II)
MQLGPWKIRAIEAERFRLDGGAMHGVVPKTLWSQYAPADEQNRVEYTCRCLLLEGLDRRVLIETGNGDKWSPRDAELYAIEPSAGIDRRLRAIGVDPLTIDTVVTTHLHFDHIGGAVRRENDVLVPTFPKARHVTQARELDDALHPNERNRASYRQENLEPLLRADLFTVVDGEQEIAPGVRVLPTPGHTLGHQSVLVEADGERLLFCGDVVPTSVHLRLPWVMGFDAFPVMTLETKRVLLQRAVREQWWLVWGHDIGLAGGRIAIDDKGTAKVVQPLSI